MADVLKEDDENEVKGKEEELVIVEEDPAKAAAGETEDDSEDEDERVVKEAESSEDSEREAIRERRRQEKQERKERREKAITRDKIELDFLRKRNDELDRRLTPASGLSVAASWCKFAHRSKCQKAESLSLRIPETLRSGTRRSLR